MYYSELVKKACIISFDAHRYDVDKGGYPYVYHPFFLASRFDTENEVCTALLHDVVEDHGDVWPMERLKEAGFPEEVLSALKLLTHDDAVPYMEYVESIAADPVARAVKIADLEHNLDARRVGGRTFKKRDLYLQALAYLTERE